MYNKAPFKSHGETTRAKEIPAYCFAMKPAGLAPNHNFDEAIFFEAVSTLMISHTLALDNQIMAGRPFAVLNTLVRSHAVATAK